MINLFFNFPLEIKRQIAIDKLFEVVFNHIFTIHFHLFIHVLYISMKKIF